MFNGLTMQKGQIGKGHFELTCLFLKIRPKTKTHDLFRYATTETQQSQNRVKYCDIHQWRKIVMTSGETIIGKTRSLPNCNDCADTIVTGRIKTIRKVNSEDGIPSWP